MQKEKIRLDELLLKRNLCESIQIARSLILSGSVLVNEQKITKSGTKVLVNSDIRILDIIHKYVSRGAYKLLGAFEKFNIDVKEKICIDMGASTGGFTQILLEKGARKVFALDVGYGQLASKLANNSKVIVKDRFHIKNLNRSTLEINNIPLFIVMDLSFISLYSIFPVIQILKSESIEQKIEVVSLIKPQFECEKSELLKGIVEDKKIHFRIIKKIYKHILKVLNGKVNGICRSPIKGASGNQEYLIYWEL